VPLQKLQFRPGVNREGTTLANEGGWYDCDKVRFRSGYPEKIGGWAALSYNTFLGVCRSLWAWLTLKSFNLMGVGTNLKFYIESGGAYYDITPIRDTSTNPTNEITLAITNGSSTLTITDVNAESLQFGDFITLTGATDLGTSGTNVTAAVLNQEYQITNVLSATQYTVSLRSAVTGNITTTNGGATVTSNRTASSSTMTALEIEYQINVGEAIYTLGTGWGSAPWGGFVPGTAVSSLNGALTAAATSVTVVSTTGFSSPSGIIMVGDAAAPTVDTALLSQTNNSDTTLTVLSTAGFTTTGSILIDTEIITYTGITATTFTGCTRGAAGSTAATHALGAIVYQNKLELITYTSITGTTVFNGTVGRGADGTSATTFATTTLVYAADSFPGWGEGFTTAFGFQLRLWSQSNFGEDLLFSPRGGPFYVWEPGAGTTPAVTSRGELVDGTDVPSKINEIMVSDQTRIVIAFGCDDYGSYGVGVQDPMLIRWTSQESYTDWSLDPTTQAGSYRLSHGSEIIAALQTRQEINVWTDSAIYSMQYLGPPLVWGFTLLSDNISIASPNAMATASGVVYWMGVDKFYIYSGRVETLPCSVRTYIYNDINRDQFAQVYAGTNEGYSEIWWFYCSISGPDGTGTIDNPNTTIDRYVIFNYLDRVWYYGTMDRTAWLDSSLRPYPMGATSNNLVVYHEAAVDDGSTNPPTPIPAYVQSSDFDIGDGHNYGFVWRMIPDITFDGSFTDGQTDDKPQVNFTVRPRLNPGANYGVSNSPTVQSKDSYRTTTTYNVQQFTEIVYTRIRGRQMAFKVESNTLGTQWQLGTPRIDVRPDGRR